MAVNPITPQHGVFLKPVLVSGDELADLGVELVLNHDLSLRQRSTAAQELRHKTDRPDHDCASNSDGRSIA